MTEASKAERDDKDFAIEFAEYLAKSVERFMDYLNTTGIAVGKKAPDQQALTDHWRGLQSDIYEFRKRASKAALSAPVPCAREKEGRRWLLVPAEPPDEAAMSLSHMGSGFSVPERVKNGKWNYERLLVLLGATPSPPRRGVEREKIVEHAAQLAEQLGSPLIAEAIRTFTGALIHREVLLNDSAAKVTTPDANTHGQTGNVAAHVEQPLPGQHEGRSQKGEAKPTGSRPGTAELHDGSDKPEGDGR